MPGLKATIISEVTDKDGKVLEYREFPMKSFVENMLKILAGFNLMTWLAPKNTADAAQNSLALTVADVPALGADDTKGIVVGTSDASWGEDDIALTAKIANGTGSGQLLYGPEIVTNPVFNSGKWTFSKYRIFNNGSGGSITVKETANYVKQSYPAASDYVMAVSRDVPAPIVIPDGAAHRLTYSYELYP